MTTGPSVTCALALVVCYLVALSSIHKANLLSTHFFAHKDPPLPSHLRRRASNIPVNTGEVATRHHSNDRRLAILLPYLALDIPPYMSLFCMGAAGASSVADFIIPHNGILTDWPGRKDCPANVKFFDLGATDDMVDLMVTRMLDRKDEKQWGVPKKRLVALVSRHLETKPYSMVEYKAALGHIYQDYIPTSVYSHWAYSDFDMLFGDLERHISRDEWEDFDVTTYGYGDQDRLFVRGQFTMHRNDPNVVNQLWRPCTYMSDIDMRFFGVANGQKHRFESGEGCYSVAILQNEHISVKYAVRAWSDVQNIESIYSQGIVLTRSPGFPRRHVLVRVTEDAMVLENETGQDTPHLPSNWFETDKVYQDYTKDLHEPTSELLPIDTTEITDDCRLGWIQPEYRAKICIPPSTPVSNQTNLYWINGKRYMQHFRWRNFDNAPNHETAPYFHFMLLKRNFRENQFASVLDPALRAILLAPQGGIPLLGPVNNEAGLSADTGDQDKDENVAAKRLPSPLGLDLNRWGDCATREDCAIRQMLPQATYCFSGLSLPKRKYGIKCSDVFSWRDPSRVEIISRAPAWDTVSIESDVTLTLTVQIEVTGRRDSLSQWINLIRKNLAEWDGAPSVLLIHLSIKDGASRDKSIEALHHAFSDIPLTKKSLLAVVSSDHGVSASRRALLNMAIDAAPTRWYISGLEVERGLVLSATSLEAAHQSIKSASQVFFIPQFGLNTTSLSTNVSIDELAFANKKHLLGHPFQFDKTCSRDSDSTFSRLEDTPYRQWWGSNPLSLLIASKFTDIVGSSFLKLLDEPDRLYDFEESPILLVDNQGPRRGIWTHQLVREVEEFAGHRCYNGLRVAQLAGFGYKFSVLEGAFAVSTLATREVSLYANDPSRPGYSKCEGCFLFNNRGPDMIEMRDEIAESEMTRPAKAQALWKDLKEDDSAAF